MWLLSYVLKFSSLAWLEEFQEPPIFEVILGWHWRFLTGVLEDRVILDIMDHHYIWFLTCVPNFSSLAWLEEFQEPPILKVILGGCWRFLTGVLEDRVILDIMDRHYIWFLTGVPNFSSLAWLEVCQEGGSSSKTYLEDFDGSWQESWRTEVLTKNHDSPLETTRTITWKFEVIISLFGKVMSHWSKISIFWASQPTVSQYKKSNGQSKKSNGQSKKPNCQSKKI